MTLILTLGNERIRPINISELLTFMEAEVMGPGGQIL